MNNNTVLIFLCLILCVNGTIEEQAKKSNLCSNQTCDEESKMISRYIDEQKKPCDNFYQFACGKIDKKKKPKRLGRATHIFDIEKKNLNKLKGYLKEHSGDTEPLSIKLVKDLYKSCMDNTTRETQGIQPMLQTIKHYGGWPVVEGQNWDEKNFDWLEMNAKILKDGITVHPIIKLETSLLLKKYYLLIDVPRVFGMSETEDLRQYYNLMVNTSITFGANQKLARLEMAKVLWLESELAQISDPWEDLSGKYEHITIRDLQLQFPYINWLKFIRYVVPNDVKIDDDEEIYFNLSKYFMSLGIILKQTENRTIANYLIWRAILGSSVYFNDQNLTNHINRDGRSSDDVCFDHVNKLLPLPLGNFYIQKNSKKISDARTAVFEMASNIRSEFTKMLREAEWMSPYKEKKRLIEKVANMSFIVGYTEDLKYEMEQFSKGLELNSSNFFENALRIRKFNHNLRFQNIHISIKENPINIHKSSWTASAVYSSQDGNIYINAGMLQWPNFVIDRPSYMNYGAIGQTIGFLIAQSIEGRRLTLDRFGKSLDWSNSTNTKYTSKIDCFKNQDSKINKIGYKYLGPKTINDNVGVKAAYRAYESLPTPEESGPLLVGLENYTQRQLFWISVAHKICASFEPLDALKLIEDNRYRIYSMTRNMLEFTNDFKCSPENKMYFNDSLKCEIW